MMFVLSSDTFITDWVWIYRQNRLKLPLKRACQRTMMTQGFNFVKDVTNQKLEFALHFLSDSSPHVSTEAPSQSFGDGSLLPSVLPSTNLTQSALPIFLKEPLDTFVTKSQTAEIHCRVAHALSVHFQCNSVQEKPTQLEHHVEPESGVRYIEATLKINRDQVEEFFGDFHCACMAVSGKGPKISRHALITYACEYVFINHGERDSFIGGGGGAFVLHPLILYLSARRENTWNSGLKVNSSLSAQRHRFDCKDTHNSLIQYPP